MEDVIRVLKTQGTFIIYVYIYIYIYKTNGFTAVTNSLPPPNAESVLALRPAGASKNHGGRRSGGLPSSMASGGNPNLNYDIFSVEPPSRLILGLRMRFLLWSLHVDPNRENRGAFGLGRSLAPSNSLYPCYNPITYTYGCNPVITR